MTYLVSVTGMDSRECKDIDDILFFLSRETRLSMQALVVARNMLVASDGLILKVRSRTITAEKVAA